MAAGALLVVGMTAQARVFDFNSESLAAYLRGQYEQATDDTGPFAKSSGAQSNFSDTYPYLASYEFGFVYATSAVNLRFGFEILKPSDLKGVAGKDAAGNTLFTVDNNISGYIPKVGLEFNLKHWTQSRLFAHVMAGTATVTMQNSYTMTAAGTAAYPTVSDFREEVKGTALMYEYGVGFETLLSDTTTFAFDIGQRNLELTSLNHDLAVTNFQGTVGVGDKATFDNGQARSLNLSGLAASIMLRFWIK